MHIELSEEQQMLKEEVRRFAEEVTELKHHAAITFGHGLGNRGEVRDD